ncbi:MAG: Arc family DNA-binding protein [Opitutales bacterium]|nr:Arc family DNA-binding protein [Opitutales bacterium]MCH8540491.1 Arc family DNA-binding protein [Opitutales bacterium]
MANILLKNIPPDLHQALRERAQQEHRSLNKEVISLLAKALDHFPTEHPAGQNNPSHSPLATPPSRTEKERAPRKSIQDDLPSHLL